MFILQNPLTYTLILLNFMQSYLKVLADNYVTNFAHLYNSSFFILTWLIIGFTTITDRNEKDNLSSTLKNKLFITIISLATIALFSTAMYVITTDVGRGTIFGVQPRYKLPLLFPFLYIAGGFKIKNSIKETTYSVAVFGTMSFILLVGAWEKLVAHFFVFYV